MPPGAVLVRVLAHDHSWVRSLPMVPGGKTATVTVSSEALRAVPTDDLVSHGYRIVGVPPVRARTSIDVIDILVPRELQEAYPSWWRALLGRADRAFDCALGPVRSVLAGELSLHLAGLEPTER